MATRLVVLLRTTDHCMPVARWPRIGNLYNHPKNILNLHRVIPVDNPFTPPITTARNLPPILALDKPGILPIKTTVEMAAAVEAYCVKCKAKRNMKEANEVTMANGRKAMKGKCPECGTGMFKILGK